MKKKIIILISLIIVLVICIIILFNNKNSNNAFIGKWIYGCDKFQSILDNNNGNVITETKNIKHLVISKNNKYSLFYDEKSENGKYSINDNEIILTDNNNTIIDKCSLDNKRLICDFYSFFKKK